MTGFFKKIFGGKSSGNSVEALVEQLVRDLISKSGLEIDFDLQNSQSASGDPQLNIELNGPDEDLMKEREGQLIDAFQLFVKRVVQHNFPDDQTVILVDCGGYRQESEQALIEMAEKYKSAALEKGKSVYIRALAPKDRKVIHQYLAEDGRVKSRSIGDGLFKKIKIFPTSESSADSREENHDN